ncbi:glycosyltransferase family 2 protein [uncultured Ruegeria sp.]|uniref:glycosyltransferase family 2 protein n=1 Tax=uncultured Ruegeria sp. TaxID=259304 RepID=UPI00262E3EF3|nr:glycosyltransferase family 2 protein [uncultured Ruegeria sp.]
MSQITIISVCYNSSEILPEMLNSIPEDVPIVLVDNGSGDIEMVRQMAEAHGATLVESPENIGFGRACNLGAVEATTDLLLFLNPDSHLLPGALDALKKGADNHPDASAFNPAILDKKGEPRFRRYSVILPGSKALPRKSADSDFELPVLVGAAMLIRREAFEAVGGFDPKIFLYHEDDDLSLRLKAVCGPLYYIHDAQMRHARGKSSPGSSAIAGLKGWYMGQSRVYVARKHEVPFALGRALSSALLQMVSPVVLFSARKRAKQWSFLRGVWQGRGVRPTPFRS